MQALNEVATLDRELGSIETFGRPAAVLESFVRLIEDEEVSAAIYLLSHSTIEKLGTSTLESIFSETALGIRLAGGVEMVDVQTSAFSKDHAEMQLTVWYGDHMVETEIVELCRENEQWKISLVKAGVPSM